MSTFGVLKEAVEAAPAGALFNTGDFEMYGSRTAVESALSRLVRSGSLSRVRRGIYFRPAVSRFGKGGVSGVAAALKYAADRAAGPVGPAAAVMLGLSTQMPAVPEIAVVGRPPTSIPGVHFRERSNMKRVAMNLNPKEVAILELARDRFASVEAPFAEVKVCFRDLVRSGEIDSHKINEAARGEPRSAQRFVAELLPA